LGSNVIALVSHDWPSHEVGWWHKVVRIPWRLDPVQSQIEVDEETKGTDCCKSSHSLFELTLNERVDLDQEKESATDCQGKE
jgi:hypothetical protein